MIPQGTYYQPDSRDERIEELENVLRDIIADAMDNPTSIKAIVTWTSIHKAQKLLEES